MSRHRAALLAWAALTLLSLRTAAYGEQSNPTAVILPGQEALLADMLGRGATLPDGCTFTGGQVEQTAARGTYDCSGSEIAIELRHPTTAPPDGTSAEKLAVVTVRGTPPAALIAALRERVRQREAAFEWTTPSAGVKTKEHEVPRGCWAAAPLENRLGPYVPGCYPRVLALVVAVAQCFAIVLGLGYGLVTLYRLDRP